MSWAPSGEGMRNDPSGPTGRGGVAAAKPAVLKSSPWRETDSGLSLLTCRWRARGRCRFGRAPPYEVSCTKRPNSRQLGLHRPNFRVCKSSLITTDEAATGPVLFLTGVGPWKTQEAARHTFRECFVPILSRHEPRAASHESALLVSGIRHGVNHVTFKQELWCAGESFETFFFPVLLCPSGGPHRCLRREAVLRQMTL